MRSGGPVKAQEWLERGIRETDPIHAFSDFWRGFNNLFFSAAKGQERDKIRAFLAQRVSEEEAKAMLGKYSAEIDYLISQSVIDMRGNGRDTADNIHAFMVSPTSLGKVEEVFMIIYQVRCNLEHGQKSPSRERDIQLCQSASPLVAHVIERNA
jgi:hypothetical protein